MNARIVPSDEKSSRVGDPRSNMADVCPECSSAGLVEDAHRGELICTSCGAVLDRGAFDFSQEKRAYTAEEVESRKHNGSPITALSDIAWTTVLRANDKNASPSLKRAARWNSRLSWDKRNLLMAVTEIKRVCSALGVPRLVAETAATYYRKVQKMNVLRGRSISGFVGACVYLACRTSKIPRSVDDIYKDMPETTDRDIRICYRVLIGELKVRVPKISAAALLPRYTSVLALPQETCNLAERMLVAFEARNNTAGKDPKGLIAAAIYLACKMRDEETAQKRVATACGVTEVTLRSRIKDFAPVIAAVRKK
nr:TFIIB-type zinc ribbon-containing protein [Candidatus Sigynarchaeum springense]